MYSDFLSGRVTKITIISDLSIEDLAKALNVNNNHMLIWEIAFVKIFPFRVCPCE